MAKADPNPKRRRGTQRITPLTLRVKMPQRKMFECGRVKRNNPKPQNGCGAFEANRHFNRKGVTPRLELGWMERG